MNAQQRIELEKMIDLHGLPEVMMALSNICEEKADHLRVNWQASKEEYKPWLWSQTWLRKATDKIITLF